MQKKSRMKGDSAHKVIFTFYRWYFKLFQVEIALKITQQNQN